MTKSCVEVFTMNYIVFDLEWNQGYVHNSVKDMPFEIIEIGAYKVDENLNVLDTFSAFIKPRYYKKLHYQVKRVVSISQEELDSGEDFQEVGKKFVDWCGEDFCFCTWGVCDVSALRSNLDFYGIKYDFGDPVFYIDIQKLFSFQHFSDLNRLPLKSAVEMADINQTEPFHRAIIDAKYTYLVMQNIDFEVLKVYRTMDLYTIPSGKEEEVHFIYENGYYKYISRGFENTLAATSDKRVLETPCPLCYSRLSRPVNWFKYNSHTYQCIANCSVHGDYFGVIKIKHCNDDVYVVKVLKRVAPNVRLEVAKKRCEAIERKKEKRKREIGEMKKHG